MTLPSCDLLHAMGYRTGRDDLKRVGGTGDAGIDRVISLDRLGLELEHPSSSEAFGKGGQAPSPFQLRQPPRSPSPLRRPLRPAGFEGSVHHHIYLHPACGGVCAERRTDRAHRRRAVKFIFHRFDLVIDGRGDAPVLALYLGFASRHVISVHHLHDHGTVVTLFTVPKMGTNAYYRKK